MLHLADMGKPVAARKGVGAQAVQALCRTAELGEHKAAEMLMLHGADPLKTCHRGDSETTPLQIAIDLGNVEFVKCFTAIHKEAPQPQLITLQTGCNGVTPLLR